MLSYLHYLILGLISTRSVTYAATKNANVGIDTNDFENGRIPRPFQANFVRLFQPSPRVVRPFSFMRPFFKVKTVHTLGYDNLSFVNF